MTARHKNTPVRRSLKNSSVLIGSIKDGMGAVKECDHKYLAKDIRKHFADSLDLDAALEPGREEENRWDYLLGHTASVQVVALEPHSARQDQISTVIKKKKAAVQQLADHLNSSARIAKWIWVASGKDHFADTEKARIRLDQNGIQFAGTQVLAKHLPVGTARRKRV